MRGGESTKKSTEPAILRPTRGRGLLEAPLARLRAARADRLIRNELRAGRILDIGCGSRPYFLSHTYFAEKFAVDQVISVPDVDVDWLQLDLNSGRHLPFEDGFFAVVTMLAVVEHLDPETLVLLLCDIHRIVRPGGQLILTTPASWSSCFLHVMAAAGLVSGEEIREHRYAYGVPLLKRYLSLAGFAVTRARFGHFELGANTWAVAER